ncbi:hypothetical protein Shyd_86930 [Streptomyces hydrogenans]|uniref:Uncharacterized protein n=1 Tax=Streptomyces hydrogenans TaxID=1873719 RepID=A0ABQ3PQK7_9ACTN|nr:hypothetical protein GCM10018784_78640 [Streptomyces hydrogenans]GHI27322.1 hypothetical protein Shyd_86930 [Streptomyces hydrogenans]
MRPARGVIQALHNPPTLTPHLHAHSWMVKRPGPPANAVGVASVVEGGAGTQALAAALPPVFSKGTLLEAVVGKVFA